MRLRALHEFTNNIPAIECSSAFKQIGQNTRDAILSGVMNGVLFEIQTYIDRFKEKYPEAIIILTGVDVVFLKDTLKRDIYFEEKLVLIGLNQLLEYQLHLK